MTGSDPPVIFVTIDEIGLIFVLEEPIQVEVMRLWLVHVFLNTLSRIRESGLDLLRTSPVAICFIFDMENLARDAIFLSRFSASGQFVFCSVCANRAGRSHDSAGLKENIQNPFTRSPLLDSISSAVCFSALLRCYSPDMCCSGCTLCAKFSKTRHFLFLFNCTTSSVLWSCALSVLLLWRTINNGHLSQIFAAACCT
eukprot:TRINITY_DN3218_c0_g1_i2.p1 TRINITY_DN3218_c0_g1~~TRINITY_DN3218_c0_g1_i2.p1  ORF type:complete len:198 (-),score=2.86 TRINITY_DN3218_c0_g1_i2:54-647(-)